MIKQLGKHKDKRNKTSKVKFEFFAKLNKILGGLCAGEFVFIGARTGIGKTNLALNFTFDLASQNKRVLFESVEMSYNELKKRLDKICLGCKSKFENIFINDETSNIETIESDIEKIKPNVVVVDYIGILSGNIKSNSNRLREIAKKHQVPIIVLGQLNRLSCGKSPSLHNISGSSFIECDSNCVILLTENVISIAKNRKGKVGEVPYIFDKKHLLFVEV